MTPAEYQLRRAEFLKPKPQIRSVTDTNFELYRQQRGQPAKSNVAALVESRLREIAAASAGTDERVLNVLKARAAERQREGRSSVVYDDQITKLESKLAKEEARRAFLQSDEYEATLPILQAQRALIERFTPHLLESFDVEAQLYTGLHIDSDELLTAVAKLTRQATVKEHQSRLEAEAQTLAAEKLLVDTLQQQAATNQENAALIKAAQPPTTPE